MLDFTKLEPGRVGFSFRLEGQPPSGNHRLSPALRWSKPKTGEAKPYVGWKRAKGIENFMLYVTVMTKRAIPKDWIPGSKIRVSYLFELDNDMDCDNAMKVISDAIALGLGVDDSRFLPCVLDKTTKHKDPGVSVFIENLTDDYDYRSHFE
jgi:Holliday junction resolvase RusA-like endonuclease